MSCIHSACAYFYSDCGDIEGVNPYCHFDSVDDAGIIPPCGSKQILGERWDDYTGFDCDNYDPYDPFEVEVTDMSGWYSWDYERFTDFLDDVGIDYDVNEDGDVTILDERILKEV